MIPVDLRPPMQLGPISPEGLRASPRCWRLDRPGTYSTTSKRLSRLLFAGQREISLFLTGTTALAHPTTGCAIFVRSTTLISSFEVSRVLMWHIIGKDLVPVEVVRCMERATAARTRLHKPRSTINPLFKVRFSRLGMEPHDTNLGMRYKNKRLQAS